MRPLRIDLAVADERETFGSTNPVASLIDAFGAYCAICERPTRERLFAWDPRTGATVTNTADLEVATLLPLCVTCRDAQLGSTTELGVLALPISQLGVGIRPPWLFEVDRHADLQAGELAPEAAEATIRHFRLNADDDDPRRMHRARALAAARRAAAKWDFEGSADLDTLAELMTVTGFLSVWIDALYGQFVRTEPILELLERGRESAPEFFPGTDWAALAVEAQNA